MPPELPEQLVAQATYRRNGLAVFDRPDPRRTALLVMNLQNAWFADGAPFGAATAELQPGLVDRINRFAAWVRAAGGLVLWFRTTVGPADSPQAWNTYYDNFIEPGKRAVALAALAPTSPMHALHTDADVQDGDLVLDKYRFSAFVRNPYDLETQLRDLGVDTVAVAGTATNICCESTIRDAMMRDLRTFMPHDLVAAPTAHGHVAGLRSVMQAFADVRPTGDLIA
jgi:ureidoacrylate peracid hydrolase